MVLLGDLPDETRVLLSYSAQREECGLTRCVVQNLQNLFGVGLNPAIESGPVLLFNTIGKGAYLEVVFDVKCQCVANWRYSVSWRVRPRLSNSRSSPSKEGRQPKCYGACPAVDCGFPIEAF